MTIRKETRGRKKITVTTDHLKKIETLASRGLMDKEIMAVMGWSKDFFYKKKRQEKEFNDSIEKGRASGHLQLANKLFESGMAGNVSAMQYYLARRCGWSEKVQTEELNTRPIEINLIDAPVSGPDSFD